MLNVKIDDINKMAIELLCFITSNEAQGIDMVVNDNHNYKIVSSTQEFFEKIGMEFVELRENLVSARYINEMGNDIEIRYNDKYDFEKDIILEVL